MGKYKNEQRRLAHRGRQFHFISYEGQEADPRKKLPAMPATWYLESSGNRWPAIPHILEQTDSELDAQLAVWLEAFVFAPAPPKVPAPEPPPQRFLKLERIETVPARP